MAARRSCCSCVSSQGLLLVFLISTVLCDLNLPKGAECESGGVNGTCVALEECPSAAFSNLYKEAGFTLGDSIADLPEFCARGDQPLVCCTDCLRGRSGFNDYVVAPMGVLLVKKPSVAYTKCYEYFKRLPYPCRGVGNVHVKKSWSVEKRCHQLTSGAALAVGGRDAQRWEFPHMALLGYGSNRESAEWLCGGTVISERYILTAAHCTSSSALGPIKFAALGLLKRTDPKETWKVYDIKRIVKHPDYKPPSKYHDIALLETETELTFGLDLLPACLDIGEKTISAAEASGWGSIGHHQALADTLQVVDVSEFDAEECATQFPVHRHLRQGYDNSTQLCFGSHYHVVDTCQGDSGGPLQTNQFKCLYSVVGVTSFGKNCGTLGSPGVYTRVSHYVPWVESVVWPADTTDVNKKNDVASVKFLNIY